MPCLELSLPKQTKETRAALARDLTEAFCSATGHPASIFGIRFFETEPGMSAVGGRLDGEDYLHLLLYCPRLKRSAKQKVGAALTEACEKWLKLTPTIHISEHPYDNVVVGGKLLTDAYEECARRSFYYELPREE